MPEVRDDSEMSRFDRWGLRRFTARQAIWSVALVTLLLVLFAGQAVRKQGEEMSPGIARDLVLAVGKPAGWLADRLPLADLASSATSWLSPDESLAGASHGFAANRPTGGAGAGGASGGVQPVTPDYFDPAALGQQVPPRQLHTLLVTGDSLSTPLDIQLAQRLTGAGVDVIRDPHLATGISKTAFVDWGRLAATQVALRPSGRGRGLHRRQRGLFDARPGRQAGELLRARLGGDLRRPRSPDDRTPISRAGGPASTG